MKAVVLTFGLLVMSTGLLLVRRAIVVLLGLDWREDSFTGFQSFGSGSNLGKVSSGLLLSSTKSYMPKNIYCAAKELIVLSSSQSENIY